VSFGFRLKRRPNSKSERFFFTGRSIECKIYFQRCGILMLDFFSAGLNYSKRKIVWKLSARRFHFSEYEPQINLSSHKK
jgi:hypothetical protein